MTFFARVVHIFPKICKSPENSGNEKGDMEQVPYWGPTNITSHSTRFCGHGGLAAGICAPLFFCSTLQCKRWQDWIKETYFTSFHGVARGKITFYTFTVTVTSNLTVVCWYFLRYFIFDKLVRLLVASLERHCLFTSQSGNSPHFM
jgi:hypothetical protein